MGTRHPIIDAAAPKGVAPRTRAMLAAMSHAMYNATLGEVYERKERDPSTGAHLFAAITAMCADEREGSVERMRIKADEFDPIQWGSARAAFESRRGPYLRRHG